MIIFDAILDQYETEQDAIDYANGIDWQEVETREGKELIYSNYIDTVNGVGVYYCFGADHFWFTDEEGE